MVVRRQPVRLENGNSTDNSSDELYQHSELEGLIPGGRTVGGSGSGASVENGTAAATATTTSFYRNGVSRSDSSTTTTASLNLDHLTKIKHSIKARSPPKSGTMTEQDANTECSSRDKKKRSRTSAAFQQLCCFCQGPSSTASRRRRFGNNHRPGSGSSGSSGSSTDCAARCSILCLSNPYTCGTVLLAAILAIMVALIHIDHLVNPTRHYGALSQQRYDYYVNIQSSYDFTMGDIDHWCLGGGNDYCLHCQDPIIPVHRAEFKSWIEAWKANRRMLERRFAHDAVARAKLDVVFLGESIVEELDGRWMGRQDRSAGLSKLAAIFDEHFSKNATTILPSTSSSSGNSSAASTSANNSSGSSTTNQDVVRKAATVEGIALGIAGDTAPNVLWRLMHGEMPKYLNPKVWWLSLGNNDLARTECSEEVVVIGILRIVEEILQQRKDAKIVINSMFPMTSTRGGFYPLISDFEDSFSRLEGNRREQRRRSLLQSTVTLQSTRNRTVAGVSFGNDPIDRARIYRKLRKQKRSRSIGGDGSSASTELSEDAWSKDMTAEAQEEEERREQLAKTKKVRNRNKRDDRNPTLTDRENIRAYEWNGESTAKPLWTSIRVINKALRDFAAKNKDRVHFFDATDIFTKKVGKSYTLLTDRISIRGHPTELGFRLWEDAMVATLEDILAVMRKEQPKLFVIPTPPSSSSSTFSGLESNGVGGDGNGGKPKDDDEFAGALRAPYDDPFSIFQSSESEQWRLPNDGTDDKNDVDDPNDGGDLVVDNGSVGDNVDATDDGG